MRVVYKGNAITTYGDRVSITDREGREVYNDTNGSIKTEEEAKQFLKEFMKGGESNGRVSQQSW